MKDPGDRKKPELPPLESLLSAEFVPTPYGLACSKMEVLCLNCRKGEIIAVSQKTLNMIDSEDLAGSAIAEYMAEQKGWLIKPVNRTGGKQGLFMLCPQCVENFFTAFEK